MRNVLALILAGGKGSRLEPLSRERAKPAVPFGGVYRIIDFTLSNCLNSGLRRILVLTQYKAASLDRHINLGWRFLCRELDEFIDVLPPQQRLDEQWYQGTADAVYQNIYTIEKSRAEHIIILSGDHIYKMDYAELINDHIRSNADATVACLPVTLKEGSEFGVMNIDGNHRVVDFAEKPNQPQNIPGDPDHCLASMGVYVFKANFLFDQLCRDATFPHSKHDFGRQHHSFHHRQLPRAGVSLSGQEHGRHLLLAGRGHARCVLRSQYGFDFDPSAFEFVRPELGTADLSSELSAAEVRV